MDKRNDVEVEGICVVNGVVVSSPDFQRIQFLSGRGAAAYFQLIKKQQQSNGYFQRIPAEQRNALTELQRMVYARHVRS